MNYNKLKLIYPQYSKEIDVLKKVNKKSFTINDLLSIEKFDHNNMIPLLHYLKQDNILNGYYLVTNNNGTSYKAKNFDEIKENPSNIKVLFEEII